MSSQERKKCIKCKVNLLLNEFKKRRDGNYTSYCIVCLDKNKKNRNKRKEKNKDKFECTECYMKFSVKEGLKCHIKQVHDKIKDFYCKECNYSCSNNNDLRKHSKTCSGKEHIASGEYQVRECLKEMNIKFDHNTSYIVKDVNLLLWDFVLYKDNKVEGFIEYDGKQHYMPICFGGISIEQAKENLISCQKRDKIKNDFCKEHNYPLLRIPYTEFGNIPQMVTEFCVEYLDWGYE